MLTCGNHYDAGVEPRPVFADPSGRRHRVLRFAGIGSTAVLVAFLVAVVLAVTGGPQAPFTQWAVPQAPAPRATHAGDQALTGGNAKSGTPTGSSGTGGGASAGGTVSAGATTPGQSATASPSKTNSAGPTSSPTPSPTASATVSPAASPTATTHGNGHANPHSSKSPKP